MLQESVVVGLLLYILYYTVAHWKIAIGCDPRMGKNDRLSPLTKPFTGNLLALISAFGYGVEFQAEGIRKFGHGLVFTLPFRKFHDMTSPKLIEFVQKTQFKSFRKGYMLEPAKDVLGNGIFATDGPTWTVQRKTVANIFTNANFSGIISECIFSDCEKVSRYLSETKRNGSAIDLRDLFFAFTLSSFMRMAFGVDPGCLTEKGYVKVPFATAFDFAQEQIVTRMIFPMLYYIEPLLPSGREMKRCLKTMDDYTYGIIDSRIEGREKGGQNEVQRNLLDLFLDARDPDGKPLTRTFLRDTVLNLIIAGRDTTAQALSWTWYRLLHDRPDWLEKVKKEVQNAGSVTFENHKMLVHTVAAFSEGLRLHPSVPRNTFVAQNDVVTPEGHLIRKGEPIIWSDWAMARQTSVWGEDAAEYKPERWIIEGEDGELTLAKFSQFQYHVFNAGPRLCLGMNLAVFEAVMLTATMARDFDFTLTPEFFTYPRTSHYQGENTPMYRMSLTLPMLNPLPVTVH